MLVSRSVPCNKILELDDHFHGFPLQGHRFGGCLIVGFGRVGLLHLVSLRCLKSKKDIKGR